MNQVNLILLTALFLGIPLNLLANGSSESFNQPLPLKVEKTAPKNESGVVDADPNASTKEIYTSMFELNNFFQRERVYVEDIRIILDKKLVSHGATGVLGAYLSSYDDIIGLQDEDETYMYNPLNVYCLMRHVAVGWPIVESTLKEEKKRFPGQLAKRVRRVMARRSRDHIPEDADLDGVASGIVRLHSFYQFNLTSFIDEGVFETQDWRSETTGDLLSWDAFKIGVKGTNMLILGSGIEIMLHALAKAEAEGTITVPPFIEKLEIGVFKNIIKTAKTVHDQKLDSWGALTALHSTNFVPYSKRLAKKKKYQNLKPKKIKLNTLKIAEKEQEMLQYIDLCRSNDLRPANLTAEMYCHYSHANKPYYFYGPRRIEIVSKRPHIVLLHNFITDGESESIIQAAGPRLRRSTMVGNQKNASKADDRRVSEQTWLTENDVEALQVISRRFDYYLDFESQSSIHSEPYQVANYGLAGQYAAHYDPVKISDAKKPKKPSRDAFTNYAGDRMATLMGYLTEVMVGGNTVFPLVGAYVKPSKGTVVLWWNMDQAGGYDILSRHGGCPVLIGSKWILNKWIHMNSQMFKRPCPKYTSRQIRGFRNNDAYQKGGFFTDPKMDDDKGSKW